MPNKPIEILIDDRQVQDLIKRIAEKTDDLTPIMQNIASIMLDAVEQNFAESGRPKWPNLAPATIAARTRRGTWPGQILIESGHLASSISTEVGKDFAKVGTNVPYAPFLQQGTNHMPARPFFALTPKDLEDIQSALADFLDSL